MDAGNGSGGFFAEKVVAPLGADISPSQFLTPDGAFPNHAPNPENKAAMESAAAAVLKGRYVLLRRILFFDIVIRIIVCRKNK